MFSQSLNLEQMFNLKQPSKASTNANTKQYHPPIHQLFKLSKNYNQKQNPCLPRYLSNLNYPPCDIQEHQQQPLSMLCIDKDCQNKGLICGLCEGNHHFEHLCVPLKVYLNQVYGHLIEEHHEYNQFAANNTEAKNIMPNIQQPSLQKKAKKNRNKNKNKNKSQVPGQQVPKVCPSPHSHPNKSNSKLPPSTNILQYTQALQTQKITIIKSIRQCREQILEKLHIYETQIIKYFNNIISEVSLIVPLENPLQKINKIMNGINWYRERIQNQLDKINHNMIDRNGFKDQQMDLHNIQQSSKVNQYRTQLKLQTKSLKNFMKSIISHTKFEQKFNMQQILQIIKQSTTSFNLIHKKQFIGAYEKYKEIIDKQIKQLELKINKSKTSDLNQLKSLKNVQYRFSQKFKGHKFVVRNQGKVTQQTGMESSGQRFLLMQPPLPKAKDYIHKKALTWCIKVTKLVGWIAVGISLKNAIVKANYNFHYTNIGHGSYLISGNGYSWSHSMKQYNSAYKSFNFTTGDTIHIKYNPMEKKIKFVKNQNQKQFTMDVVDPPFDDQFVPSVNMCSSGDTLQILQNTLQNL